MTDEFYREIPPHIDAGGAKEDKEDKKRKAELRAYRQAHPNRWFMAAVMPNADRKEVKR